MIRLFRDVLRLFPPGDALRLVGLTVMMAVSVLLELAGIGLIPMFLLLLTEPDRVSGLPVLSSVVERFGMPEPATLLVYGALGLIALFLVKNVYTVAFQYIFARFTFNRFTYLSEALFRRYMHAPYVYHLGRNSASLIRNISQEAYILIKDVFNAGLHLLMDSILILGVLILLLIVEPFITLAATSLMVLAAGGLLRLLRSRTQVYGKSVRRDRKRMIQAIQEGLGGFKDIRILARENWFIELFRESVRRYARAQVFKHMAGSLTRPVIETLAVAGMLLIVLLLHHQGRSMQSIVPLLVLFGAATLRVMPALSRAVSGYNSIRFSMHSVDAIREDMVALGLPP